MPDRDMVSWNTMLDGYAKAGEMDRAFELFERMPQRNIVSWSTMVCGYSKGGDMDMARVLFDRCPAKNVVLWTTIIAGYAEKGFVREATELYGTMEEAGLRPDDGFLISILAACAESGMLGLGKRIHASMRRWRFRCGTKVLNAFIDMYAKCGCEQEQQQRCNTSWDINCLGTGCDGAGLLCWSHLWCPFQSCCHHCFCLHQKVSLEAGEPTTTFFPSPLIFGSSR